MRVGKLKYPAEADTDADALAGTVVVTAGRVVVVVVVVVVVAAAAPETVQPLFSVGVIPFRALPGQPVLPAV